MREQQHEPQEEQYPAFTFGQKATIFTPTLLFSEAALALLHAPLPLEVGALVGAFFLAKNSPELLPWLAPYLTKHARGPGEEGEEDTQSWTLKDRLLGRHLQEQTSSHGRGAKEEEEEEGGGLTWDEPEEEEEEEGALTPPRKQGAKFLFSEVLKTFTPSKDRIFLARTQDGQDLFCSAKDLCHVAIAGVTGGGKSSIQRMLMLQLCRARMNVLWLNPHYTRFDLDSGEDWTPFDPYLLHPPMECRTYEVIEHYLKHMALELIPRRLERRARSLPLGKPYFIFLDELPAIVRHIKDAPRYMQTILEEGRKVGVFLIVASQDFLIKTINPDGGGGSIRECYRTAFYVGGDATTGRTILDMPAKLIPEASLGKGSAMLRGVPQKEAKQSFVPYVENAVLYQLLGPSTFHRGADVREETREEEEESEELDTPETGERERILDTIVRMAQTDTLDEKELLRLIEQLPRERGDEGEEGEEEEEEPVERTPSQLEVAVDAYGEGATSISKLAAKLNISPWEARNLMPKVEEAWKKRSADTACMCTPHTHTDRQKKLSVKRGAGIRAHTHTRTR